MNSVLASLFGLLLLNVLAAQQFLNKNETDSLASSDEDENQLVVVDTRGRGQGNVFEKWMSENKKSYKGSIKTMQEAKLIFFESIRINEEHNSRPNETYKRSVSSHSDLTFEEKKKFRLGLDRYRLSARTRSMTLGPMIAARNSTLMPNVNYTKHFPPAKNQLYCGCCYAFATVSVVEYYARKAGLNQTYSEQNLVDCDNLTYGCNGGWPAASLEYIRDNGISNGSTYDYEGESKPCRRDQYPAIHKISKVCEVDLENSEENLKKLIATVGPIAGAIATTDGFFNYGSGVFYDPSCNPVAIDHAITIVGYGTSGKLGDYWLIRNSWGVTWGMSGYAWVARNRNNSACGIAKYAMYPC